MKKALSIILTVIMLLACLSGCGNKTDSNTPTDTQGDTTKIDFPTEDIRVIVPFAAGGNTDSTIRALAAAMNEVGEGYNLIVENKPGASGQIGMTAIKHSAADGYTIGAISCELFLQQNLGLAGDLNLNDFDIICIPGGDPYGLVISANNPNFSTIEEFVDYAKANPGKVKIGHCGVGGMTHVALVALQNYFDLEFDLYTYGGSADCVNAINSGEIDGPFTQPNPAAAGINSGTLLMPVILASERLESFPDSPTLGEVFGDEYNMAMRGVVILGAPKGLPEEVFQALSDVAYEAAMSKTCQDQLIALGISPYVLVGDELKTFMSEQLAFYEEMCKDITIE